MSSGLTLRLANVYALEGRTQEADAWFDEAIADAERQRYVPTLALAYNLRGVTLRRRGRLDEAERVPPRCARALRRSRGARRAELEPRLARLHLRAAAGSDTGAEQHHLASLDAACDADDRRAQALALEGLAGVASLRGDDEGIGRYLGAAAVLREATGGALVRAERVDVERVLDRVRDGEVMSAAFATGRADPNAVIASARARTAAS